MPKITMTYQHTELLNTLQQMLAMQGLQPANEIIFRSVVQEHPAPDVAPQFEVVLECIPGPFPPHCPMCGKAHRALNDAGDAPLAENAVSVKRVALPPREYVASEAMPSVLDASLEESFEPPSPGEGVKRATVAAPSEEEADSNGGLTSLLAQNDRLRRERERERASRRPSLPPKLMPGESLTPPSPRPKR